ncbi:hypothetical protein GLOTRDRAFT_101286 [Gloeophyllum trabeum ATCC 11539]|uniref:Uncharacterized protein n=1 Tax=Gloeophyllum trabeum (strain ATCC 11539 / FP-39264 / Madison 617) TaxID=670483 RepID=S7RIB9_GLOTA|nr:uncharacterized protein GLOTRDRAFT_101286 [Gloeophyllum trabeum ATCC 11539]EPQ52354.1 hypothetical protein GLOTRDRAFT_101286 [Gloeophyllum trabeum ATCC 11539]
MLTVPDHLKWYTDVAYRSIRGGPELSIARKQLDGISSQTPHISSGKRATSLIHPMNDKFTDSIPVALTGERITGTRGWYL